MFHNAFAALTGRSSTPGLKLRYSEAEPDCCNFSLRFCCEAEESARGSIGQRFLISFTAAEPIPRSRFGWTKWVTAILRGSGWRCERVEDCGWDGKLVIEQRSCSKPHVEAAL